MWNEIEENINELEQTLKAYKKYQIDYAKKERKYKTAQSQKLIELRAEGSPVTHLSDIVKGIPEIAQLRYERDLAEGLVKSAEEGINFYKLKIRILESQLNREWGNVR